MQLADQKSEISQKDQRSFKLKGLDLPHPHLSVVILFALANALCTMAFSCIVPFFPTEATEHKGLSTTQVGLLIGVFQLVIFIASPFIGKYMAKIQSNRSFSGGLLLAGLSTIAFGLSNLLPAGQIFFIGILLIRIGQALGSSLFTTGSWAIVGRLFPESIGLITGVLETAYGIGFTVGPIVGSALYIAGGYSLPLFCVGSSLLLVVPLSLPLHFGSLAKALSSAGDDQQSRSPALLPLLCIPEIFLTIIALLIVSIVWVFYEPSLAQHLSSFTQFSPSALVGFMMSMLSLSYLISAPIMGYLLDRFFSRRTTSLRLTGSAFLMLTLLLVGPSPLLGISSWGQSSLPLIASSFFFLGISGAILYIPAFKWCLQAMKKRGFDEKSPTICGCISAFMQSSTSLGAFAGNAFGGFSAEKVGFAWTATEIAGLVIAYTLVEIGFALTNYLRRKLNARISPS